MTENRGNRGRGRARGRARYNGTRSDHSRSHDSPIDVEMPEVHLPINVDTETPVNRRRRQIRECQQRRRQQIRETETTSDRENRLAQNSLNESLRRQNESPDQRENRLAQNRANDSLRRQSESPDQRENRLAQYRVNDSLRRQSQSPADRENNVAQMRAQHRANRLSETDEQRNERLRLAAHTRRSTLVNKNAALRGYDINTVALHNCGKFEMKCPKCDAMYFKEESITSGAYTKCCHKGKANPPLLRECPPYLKSLYIGDDRFSKNFRENIRKYNCATSFSSIGAQVTENLPGRGPQCYRIHGQIYHRTSNVRPNAGFRPSYAQLYILDSDAALLERMNHSANSNCIQEVMNKLDLEIRDVNPYAEAFKMLIDYEAELLGADENNVVNLKMYIKDTNPVANSHRGRFNAPKVNEVAMVFTSTDGAPPSTRDICIYPRAGGLINISSINPNCDPMSYVLLFPLGDRGWHTDMGMSELQYYSYRLHYRNVFCTIFRACKLFQQYIVDSYVKVEGSRLKYLRLNQKDLRVDSYMGLMDHINNLAEQEGVRAGVPIILPSTFIGSPRAMQQNFQDSMAIVQKYGRPDLFITFTCNPGWKEITENLLPGQAASDRPDIVSRVFDLKMKSLLKEITKEGIFGKADGYLYVIEFQKRGLPHMHLLVFLDNENKIRGPEMIDKVVSAEIPNSTSHPELHKIVKSSMIHGPCGLLNPDSPCMVDGKCTKGFPKMFLSSTCDNADGYPLYMRRDNGTNFKIRIDNNEITVDNRWVVPYNPYLSKKYNAHINVEICSSVKAIKYLFKHVYKGYDCANVQIGNDQTLGWDEISTFLNARYISAPEAIWRLFEKPMHGKSHSIMRLPVHLENCQTVFIHNSEEQRALDRAQLRKTMLTAWFELNKNDVAARGYLYIEIPSHYTFDKSKCIWKKRVQITKGDCVISRMYSASPKYSERFHLRMLLCHVPGATSYEFLRTFNNTTFATYKEACKERQLLDDDAEWARSLNEACLSQMPKQLRHLFSMIVAFCKPSDALQLWNTFKTNLIEDFLLTDDQAESERKALIEIEDFLLQHGFRMAKIPLPVPSRVSVNRCSTDYDVEAEKSESEMLISMLTVDQRKIYDEVMFACQTPSRPTSVKAFCINAPGGVGKSFIFNALLTTVRGNNEIAVAVAWTGIAAILLKGGRTCHSKFKLPIPTLDSSSCNMPQNSPEGRQLKAAKLIIWDECTLVPHDAMAAVDRLLKDLMQNNIPFGGKVVLLGGDWRQSLPITFHSNRVTQVHACLKNSPLWPRFKQFNLEKNMRANPNEIEFAKWLLELGNGSLTNADNLCPEIIEVPPECVVKPVKDPIDDLINEVFGLDEIAAGQFEKLGESAILTPINEDSLKINNRLISMLPGEAVECLSADTVIGEDANEYINYPMEFINSLTPTGMPPHRLALKEGCVIMLLRNINPAMGLCNGTRLIVKKINTHVLDAEIITGHCKGERVFFPRMQLIPSDDRSVPFKLKRTQFPVRIAYCMTITKSQGQSIKGKVGIYLPEPVFAHGQLYVAFSRAHSKESVRVLVKDGNNQGKLINKSDKVFTKNVVYKEIFAV